MRCSSQGGPREHSGRLKVKNTQGIMESWTETFSPREHSGVLDGDVHSKQVQESSGQTPRLKVVVETRWRRLDPRKSKRTFKIKITTEIVGHPRMPRNSSNPKGGGILKSQRPNMLLGRSRQSMSDTYDPNPVPSDSGTSG